MDVKLSDVVLAAAGESSVEVVLPEGGRGLQLSCSGWSWVLGWMPLAARHTAISAMMARFGWLPGGAQTGWVSCWPA